MANARVLVGRRKAVRNIRKITRTMELIATSRFKKALDRATEAEAYTRKIAELAADLGAAATDITHPLLEKRDHPKRVLLLVIGSNRGLCGGYNAGIQREALQYIRKAQGENLSLHLELSGRRPITYFRFQRVSADKTYTQFEDKPAYHEVEQIADEYMRLFTSGKVDRIDVAYVKFLSAARQTPVVETLLPLTGAAVEVRHKGAAPAAPPRKVEYEFLPNAQDILQELLPVSFRVRLFKAFLDAAVSEQIARRVTMKSATENADEMIKNLSRLYNRARQAQITKEIAEVISGAEALK